METMSNKKWYVLRSKPHKERALARYAESQGHSIFFPSIPVNPVNPRSARIRPYFPGYMFVHTDIEAVGRSEFIWMPFSHGLVHVGGEPAEVDVNVLRAIKTRVAEIWEAGGLVFDQLRPGDRVVIKEGMFEGYEGIFDTCLPGSERVRILLRMIADRYVPVEVEAGALGKVE